MPSQHSPNNSQNPKSFKRFLLPLCGFVIIAICITFITKGPGKQHTVSSVVRNIHKIALSKPDGGLIGLWWISAEDINPITGQLISFNLECGPIMFGAKTAKVIVNPDMNSFSFEMTDVVAMRAVRGKHSDANDDFMLEMDSYTIGPISLREDIVADSTITLLKDLATVSGDKNNVGN
ncbi:MAG: hypothetical protein IH984_01845 [Planctomycetes bacterium]|nr:hypothetical protein [Planctomycetota bacterium]